MEQEIYKSSTMGPIKISFTARHLLQSLREAMADALDAGDANVDDQALSRARGRLAEYISKLEQKSGHYTFDTFNPSREEIQHVLKQTPTDDLLKEIASRLGLK